MKKIFTTLVAALVATTLLSAQEKKSWSFIDVSAGINAVFEARSLGGMGFNAQLSYGYFIRPAIGLRAGLQLGTGNPAKGTAGTWAVPSTAFRGAVSLDFLVDILNSFEMVTIEKCPYRIQPYIRVQETFAFASGKKAASFGIGAGLRQTYKVGKTVDLLLELNGILSLQRFWMPGTAGIIGFPMCTFGVSKRF